MHEKIIILPLDGYPNSLKALEALRLVLKSPDTLDLLAYVKINDAVHNKDLGGCALVHELKNLAADEGFDFKVFLDSKVFDVSETLKNTLAKYVNHPPDILTVSSGCSVKGILELRRLLPNTKLAMISTPTDISAGECQKRFGMSPAVKIYNELQNIRQIYQEAINEGDPVEPFDLIVCSAYELEFLKRNIPDTYEFIVPGIRDAWMHKSNEHQKRTVGVKEALQLGATYVVMFTQVMKGNPELDISAEKSRQLTIKEIKSYFKFAEPLQMLRGCGGYYRTKKDEAGNFTGRLVAYAGSYDAFEGAAVVHTPQMKNYVGAEYFNFAKAEQSSSVLDYFAELIGEEIKKSGLEFNVIAGMPMGGILLAGAIGRYLNCRTVFAEKKILALADIGSGAKEQSELVLDRHGIRKGDKVIVIEDVCNNLSTPQKIEPVIKDLGGELIAIVCAFNRSAKMKWEEIPILTSCFIPTEQFRQDDPKVASLVAAGNVSWKPKYEWDSLTEEIAGENVNLKPEAWEILKT